MPIDRRSRLSRRVPDGSQEQEPFPSGVAATPTTGFSAVPAVDPSNGGDG